MLTAADFARQQADMAEIIGDNETSIVIRRGTTTLAAQTVRIERAGRALGRRVQSGQAEETRGNIIVGGEVGLDIQKDDRFTYNEQLYRVTFVRPNTQMGVQAEAELSQ